MKRRALLFSLALLTTAAAGAVPTGVVYTEGEAGVRFKNGVQRDAAIGDILNTGDAVRTGGDGYAELDQKGIRLRINPDTVFTLQEKEQKGQTTGVLSLVLGSVRFRYDRITGKEPLIQSASCIAGVRGTELSVFAGVDGSTLIVVDQGAVIVEAEGVSVELSPEEAVEVRPGQPPGEKFRPPAEKIDYRSWNDEKLQALMEDPLAAFASISRQLDFYIEKTVEFHDLYTESNISLAKERARQTDLIKNQNTAEARVLEKEIIFPLSVQTAYLVLNYRYYALAALSLRRYIGGRLYLFLKLQNLQDPANEVYPEFLPRFQEMLNRFEERIVPRLLEVDI